MAVTGMANLAVRVSDVDSACEFYASHGFDVRDRMSWSGMERADVFLGPIQITLFDRPIYADAIDLPDECFLHPALFCDDLDKQLQGHDVLWGPEVVSGSFGTRRIAFIEAPGGIRLEFMEQITPPSDHLPADQPPIGDRPSMKITRILHASVNHAEAIGPTTAFYADVLGLPMAPRPDIGIPGAWLDVGDVQVHLVGFASDAGGINPSQHHICFGVDDIAVAKSDLDAAGVAYVTAMQDQGDRQVEQVFCVDPSGNNIELQEDRP